MVPASKSNPNLELWLQKQTTEWENKRMLQHPDTWNNPKSIVPHIERLLNSYQTTDPPLTKSTLTSINMGSATDVFKDSAAEESSAPIPSILQRNSQPLCHTTHLQKPQAALPKHPILLTVCYIAAICFSQHTRRTDESKTRLPKSNTDYLPG